jgi:hypothetical protein
MMADPRRWSKERSETALKLWSEGVPTIDIARQLGVSRIAVKGRLRKIGAPQRDPRARHPELVSLYRSGMSVAEIARHTGFTYSGVWSVLVKTGEKVIKPHSPKDQKAVKLDASDYRAAVDKHGETILQMRRAGVSYRRIGQQIGHSAEGVRQWVLDHGPIEQPEPEVKTPERRFEPHDDAHVMSCLAQGGFIYREVRAGRVVEVRP